jgi:ribonuclease BN (tRNA processing enzyme)
MMLMRSLAVVLCAAIWSSASTAVDAPATPAMTWTTLGTAGGPVVFAERSQPANLLSAGDRHWIVDCGDGCVERLAATGVTPAQVSTLLISHLHEDHVGGLGGFIGLRWMLAARTPLTIYGPPGIEAKVAGIIQSLAPAEMIGLPSGAPSPLPLAAMIKVITLRDGADIIADGIRVRAVRNTHFDEGGAPVENGTQSLSYRFDLGSEAIGFTGDTGPSTSVTHLFDGAALIVSEAADLRSAAAAINAPASPVPVAARPGLIRHIAEHHLTPEQAGAMATAAHARCLVLTHLSIAVPTANAAPALLADARTTFAGSVAVANDLDRFAASPAPGHDCKSK